MPDQKNQSTLRSVAEVAGFYFGIAFVIWLLCAGGVGLAFGTDGTETAAELARMDVQLMQIDCIYLVVFALAWPIWALMLDFFLKKTDPREVRGEA